MKENTNFEALLHFCQADLQAMLRCLRRMVEIESPTDSKAGVDRLASFLAKAFRRRHGHVHILRHPSAGWGVLAEFWGRKRRPDRVVGRATKPILLLGHLDTVWAVGTLARMPFHIRQGRAYGPGILDMKSGIVCGLWAIGALQALRIRPPSSVRFLLNSDEETTSVAFREEIFEEAQNARAVLVLEPAAAGGALKTARKGVGEFQVTAYGRAAHAGINPESGVNAIVELARQLPRLEGLARPERGLTVNVGVIQGGTRSNVVPERASVSIDVRIPRLEDRQVIEKRIYGLKPIHPEARLEIRGGIHRPPMERAMAADLFRKARKIGETLGMNLQEASTGGGSDGNFTAALGIPTLDGLGGVGDGAHAIDEHVVIRELPRRAALLAALLASL